MLVSSSSHQLQWEETQHEAELSVQEGHEPLVQELVQGVRQCCL